MATIEVLADGGPLLLDCSPFLELTDDEFFEFCQRNRELRIERTSHGDLQIMPPAGSDTGRIDSEFNAALNVWAHKDGTGVAFGSSAGFTLPNGAIRSPDASWARNARWNALDERQRQQFAPLYPDFVAEIRSPTDSLRALKEKMAEYMANGAQLGWLIDPREGKLHIYLPSEGVQILDNPTTVAAGPPLLGFEFDLQALWGPQ